MQESRGPRFGARVDLVATDHNRRERDGMSSGSWLRIVTPFAVSAAASTGLAVVVNLATGGGPLWLWLAVGLLTAIGFATSVWQYERQSVTSSQNSVDASGDRSVAIGRDASGVIATGDQRVPASATQPTSTGSSANSTVVMPGSVSARAERSVAVGRDFQGRITSGDHPQSPTT